MSGQFDLSALQLAWDTDFFGFPVYRLRLLDSMKFQPAVMELKRCLPENGVAYIFVDVEHGPHADETILSVGACPFGTNVALACALRFDAKTVDPHVRPLCARTDSVLDLALAAGVNSRFARDPVFAPHYGRLYRRWLDNGFSAQEAGQGSVLGYVEGGECRGFVSVSFKAALGKIELMAVDPRHRRQGIAESLLDAAGSWAFGRGVREMRVVTQGENVGACALYESVGFRKVSSTYIYHLHGERR